MKVITKKASVAFPSAVVRNCYLSFIFRSQQPPLFFLGSEYGTGRGFGCFSGGGSCHFSIFLPISSCKSLPVLPVGSPLVESTLAARVDFAANSQQA